MKPITNQSTEPDKGSCGKQRLKEAKSNQHDNQKLSRAQTMELAILMNNMCALSQHAIDAVPQAVPILRQLELDPAIVHYIESGPRAELIPQDTLPVHWVSELALKSVDDGMLDNRLGSLSTDQMHMLSRVGRIMGGAGLDGSSSKNTHCPGVGSAEKRRRRRTRKNRDQAVESPPGCLKGAPVAEHRFKHSIQNLCN
ncbi:hypothetical protein BDV33DRAFT_185271 [Aspergillus novoparasiticus]|uniref:Uncharacterized protein n=1 Tax=Aspergillus novoparasiticus TaxID=986946 RepID=A0A5N6E6I3_9EURO|nr:hypothetical protein BDV33DRAFT_185271 [Aspergillus novoparasiticus]